MLWFQDGAKTPTQSSFLVRIAEACWFATLTWGFTNCPSWRWFPKGAHSFDKEIAALAKVIEPACRAHEEHCWESQEDNW